MEKDDKSIDIEKFQERLKTRKIPEETQKIIDEELEKLKWLARAKRLEDRIHFLGRVEDVRSYLKAFDIFADNLF